MPTTFLKKKEKKEKKPIPQEMMGKHHSTYSLIEHEVGTLLCHHTNLRTYTLAIKKV